MIEFPKRYFHVDLCLLVSIDERKSTVNPAFASKRCSPFTIQFNCNIHVKMITATSMVLLLLLVHAYCRRFLLLLFLPDIRSSAKGLLRYHLMIDVGCARN
jgi:hypothetical protein